MAYSKNRRLAEIVSDTSGNLSVEGIVVPTQSSSDNDTSAASTAFVHAHVNALVDSAPGTLNTLNELAAALNDQANFGSTITTAVNAKAPLASPDFTGQIQVSNAASTIQELTVTGNNTRSTLRLNSKDSSGNSVDLRMHSLGDGPRAELFTYSNHDLAFATNNGAPQMTLDTSGNFGIGTQSPLTRLDVVKGGTTGLSSVNARTALLVQNNLSNGTVLSINAKNTGYSGIFLGDQDNEAICQIQYVHTDDKFKILTNGGGYNPFTISGQNVGIGNNSPKVLTHIGTLTGGGMQEILRLSGDYNGTNSGAFIRFTNQHDSGSNPNTGEYNLAGIKAFDYASDWGGGLALQTAPGTTGGGNLTDRLIISPDGDVLVGSSANLNVLSGSPKIQIGDGTGHSSLQWYSGTSTVS